MGAELIINMKCFALVQRYCWRSLLVFLETKEGLLHKIRAIIMDSRMSEFKGKLTFVHRAVQTVMTTEIETFSQCTVVLVAALTLMQGIVV